MSGRRDCFFGVWDYQSLEHVISLNEWGESAVFTNLVAVDGGSYGFNKLTDWSF